MRFVNARGLTGLTSGITRNQVGLELITRNCCYIK